MSFKGDKLPGSELSKANNDTIDFNLYYLERIFLGFQNDLEARFIAIYSAIIDTVVLTLILLPGFVYKNFFTMSKAIEFFMRKTAKQRRQSGVSVLESISSINIK